MKAEDVLGLLSHLWLHEPDGEIIDRARSELGLPAADPIDLASAYTDLFLMGVYPYEAVFTDPAGELNGESAQRLLTLNESFAYAPPELSAVGAPDHLGLCVGFLAHLSTLLNEPLTAPSPARSRTGETPPRTAAGAFFQGSHLSENELNAARAEFAASLLNWAPICCLAVEREPFVHPFYRALARQTREWLMVECSLSRSQDAHCGLHSKLPPNPQYSDGFGTPSGADPALHPSSFTLHPSDDEVRLRDIVRFLLAPAQCGVFLSRARLGQLAKAFHMALPFGPRFNVTEMLFTTAGEAGLIEPLITALIDEFESSASEYRRWVDQYPVWRPNADSWLARIAQTLRILAEMRQIAEAVAP